MNEIEDLKLQVQELEQKIVEKDARIDTLETRIADSLYYLTQK